MLVNACSSAWAASYSAAVATPAATMPARVFSIDICTSCLRGPSNERRLHRRVHPRRSDPGTQEPRQARPDVEVATITADGFPEPVHPVVVGRTRRLGETTGEVHVFDDDPASNTRGGGQALDGVRRIDEMAQQHA